MYVFLTFSKKTMDKEILSGSLTIKWNYSDPTPKSQGIAECIESPLLVLFSPTVLLTFGEDPSLSLDLSASISSLTLSIFRWWW